MSGWMIAWLAGWLDSAVRHEWTYHLTEDNGGRIRLQDSCWLRNELSELASLIGCKFHFKHKRARFVEGRGRRWKGAVNNAYLYTSFWLKEEHTNQVQTDLISDKISNTSDWIWYLFVYWCWQACSEGMQGPKAPDCQGPSATEKNGTNCWSFCIQKTF